MATIHAFGPFRLDADAKILFRGSEPLPVGKRAVALLRVLIERAGAPVSKDTLIDAAWSGLAVEESNLTVQIAALRRVLREVPGGDRWIETLPRRGYRFIGPVGTEGQTSATEAPAQVDAAPELAPTPLNDTERRQITAVSCEVTGKTDGMDLEDWREAVGAFRRCVSETIARHNGFIARYRSNSVLVLFGYPTAHEHDAERAVRAGLELRATVRTLRPVADAPMRCRVGVATGMAIIGDIAERGARAPEIVGDTPDLAVRLQASAQPDTVAIDRATRQLVGNLFDCRGLDAIETDGSSEPMRRWQVLAERIVESRFEALRGSALSPLIGRDEEVDLLLRRWARAKAGDGQVVVISGEPGIGKSRIARALRDRLRSDPHMPLSYFCSPHHQDSALYPQIIQLIRAAGIERDDNTEVKLDKLQSLLLQSSGNDQDMPLFAALLSIPGGDRFPLPEITPQRMKQRTLAALLDHMKRLAVPQPILMVYEDLHWIDPTSLELLSLAIEKIGDQAILLLVTTRPEFSPPWPNHRYTSTLSLNRLGRSDGEALIGGLTRSKSLPPEVVNQIIWRTDGVPLFIEELTKTVLESGLLREAADRFELKDPLPPLAIPSTLRASLLARLDRLAVVKDVAQIGAVIGREFSYSLIAAAAAIPENVLRDGLTQLVAAGLIYQRGFPPDATYQFKHALVQDASYTSLVRSRRQRLHAQIANALEEQFPDIVAREPEVLAHHFTAAGLTERGIFYWQRAGQKASDRSANVEAAAYFNVGLDLLKQLPDTPARAHQELGLQIGLGAALIVTKGHASTEVERCCLKARELCLQVGETPELAPTLFGLWRFYIVRTRLKTARELGETLLRLAEHDPSLRVVAHCALGATAFYSGVLVDSRRHLEEAIQRYTPDLRGSPAFRIGRDPGVGCLMYAGWTLWILGFPDQAVARMHEGNMMAGELSHPFTLAFARFWAAGLSQMRRDVTAVLEQAEATLALATEHGFPHWAALGATLRGWALAMRDKSEDGMAQLRRGIADWRATGASLVVPYVLTLQAEASSLLGHIEEGLRSLDDAQAVLEQHEDRWWEAEIYRLRGVLLLRQSIAAEVEAEAWLRRALEVAQSQQAKSLELRATSTLAHLWHAQGKHSKARDLLSPVYGWFTEGFDTIDLQDAKALLAELSA